MATLVLSDLHLGSASSALATPALRETLFERLADAEEVVLLGDLLSLRDAPVREVLAAAKPFLVGLGDAMAGRRIVVVPGNHDHRLAEPLLEGDLHDRAPTPLGLERVAPASSGLAVHLARALGHSEVVIAYPGIWIRDDVYATHGHYLDCHMTVPRPEAVLTALGQALVGVLSEATLQADDYEAVLAPIYAFAYRHAQAPRVRGRRAPLAAIARRAGARGWGRLAESGGLREAPLDALAAGAALGVVAGLNRIGAGRFRADLSLAELDAAGLRAMREVIARLGIDAAHVIFGHTHRAGPLQGETGWQAGGTRMTNPGAWSLDSALIGDAGPRSPYWPGRYAVVGDAGLPELRSAFEESAALPSPAG